MAKYNDEHEKEAATVAGSTQVGIHGPLAGSVPAATAQAEGGGAAAHHSGSATGARKASGGKGAVAATRYVMVTNFSYRVGSDGTVWRKTQTGWRVLRATLRQSGGYVRVTLFGNGVQRTVTVHRLMCEIFHGLERYDRFHCDLIVRHRNDVKWDNRLSNLRLGTDCHNATDRIRNNGWRNWNGILSPMQVRIVWNLRKDGWAHKEIGAIFGVGAHVALEAVKKVERLQKNPLLMQAFRRAM